ncbi:Lrp/AsnC family transcriptional regulator [Rhodobacter ferrooxidans]|uniref:Transcriptional regulator, AsnC family n=1 Tax=Rhodobacter ferrooxidans TaxID=371731 RepID=C8RZN3_9RHOB|nr:Lrp/AsnC family transcriptional regulator [Rhodobacter sp. SW2]EEW25830.1 transcriptional regulator, AsnC family [Rhodobacter sp. SW2]
MDIDDTDREIIGLLAQNARQALADVALRVGLSTSAVNDRVRRLVAQGAIRRFTLDADADALGLPVLAIVWVALRQDGEAAFTEFATAHPGITECHHVTGPWSYLIHLRCGALAGVEAFLAEMKAAGFLERSETMLALSTLRRAPLVPGGAP